VRLRLLFDCRLDIDASDLPLPGIVLVGSPVGSDDVVKQQLISKSAKVDVVLRMAADMDNAQIAMPLHRSCLSVVLFISIFWSTPPDQTLPAAAMLGTLQHFCIGRLLPRVTPLTMAQLHQAALPIKDGGIGHTVPSDVVQPAYLWSRLDTADAVAALPQIHNAVAAMQDCATYWLITSVQPSFRTARRNRMGCPDTKNIDSAKSATSPSESHSRVPRMFRLADQAFEYCRRFSDGSH
jgi:hypothetical protein